MVEPVTADGLETTLHTMKSSFAADPAPSHAQRIDRLNRLHNILVDNKDRLIAALHEDFSNRAEAETLLTEIFPVLEGIHHIKKRLKSWMRPSRRSVPLALFGARARVHYQPLGVVGIVVPWNFPILLSLSPLAGALAAGNRVMIKASEFAPQTGQLLHTMMAEAFSEDEVCVVNGDVDVATAFTRLPFDHLIFTGSTQVGHHVMRAAADNLTPVTLELGGKSPAIIHDSFPLAEAARRIALGKGINAGQACVAPDYVLVPESKQNAFVDFIQTAFETLYPSLEANDDYTTIINDRQHQRLLEYLTDAKDKGADITTINPKNEAFTNTRKMPLHIVTKTNDSMRLMQEEIFGPILPIVPYKTLNDAISYINQRPRPLALYYFDFDKSRTHQMLEATHSGGVGINDTMTQVAADDIPFGGIGPSGMGHYHGHEGFKSVSHAKGVIQKTRFDVSAFVQAPWGNRFYKAYMALQFFRFRKIK